MLNRAPVARKVAPHAAPEVPMEESPFAYTLSQAEQGWIWRLWDETGDVVAAGDAPDQVSARSCLLEAFEKIRVGEPEAANDP